MISLPTCCASDSGNVITPSCSYIWIGDANDATSEHFVTENNIGAIVNCVADLTPSVHAQKHGIDYFEIKGLHDRGHHNIKRFFEPVKQFIDKVLQKRGQDEKRNILVHCTSGVSRSSTLVLAYLMQTGHVSVREALSTARRSRPCVEPNFGFWRQLLELEAELGLCTEESYPLEEYVFDSFREVWFCDAESGTNTNNSSWTLEEQRTRAGAVISEMIEKHGTNMFELENILYDYQFQT